jgi:hypothetical protein
MDSERLEIYIFSKYRLFWACYSAFCAGWCACSLMVAINSGSKGWAIAQAVCIVANVAFAIFHARKSGLRIVLQHKTDSLPIDLEPVVRDGQ